MKQNGKEDQCDHNMLVNYIILIDFLENMQFAILSNYWKIITKYYKLTLDFI